MSSTESTDTANLKRKERRKGLLLIAISPMISALTFIAMITTGWVDPDTADKATAAFVVFTTCGICVVPLAFGFRYLKKGNQLLVK